MGIIFQPDKILKKPIEKVKQIQSAPILFIPDNFNPQYLGRPLPETQKELKERILSACVILIPKNSTIRDCLEWINQPKTEELTAPFMEFLNLTNYHFKRW